ncbi:MAG: hypothetical protein ACRDAM_09215 [Casimicrobium sp.]
MGQPLFERTGRGVVPTAAALAMARKRRLLRAESLRCTEKTSRIEHCEKTAD